MNPTLSKSLLTFGLLAASVLQASAAEPNGDQILRQMCAKLAATQSFSFEATRGIDAGLIAGQNIQAEARVSVSVQRPNRIAAHGVGKAGSRRVIFDGRTLTMVDEKKNLYATVPMRTTIDGLVNQLDEKYGFTPPLAEFAVSNPYSEFRSEAQSVSYRGKEKIGAGFLGLGGVECYHLGLKGKAADAELWIGVADQLPRKLVATFHRKGNPQVRVAFSTWNLATRPAAAEFAFTPAKGAMKIDMWTTAKMQATLKH